ncbi:MAG TPA: outer membrane beta-barrel protein [Puia sp.]|jgi:hypothetical protein|nr:outer membrane beta-barrel protein [Puia sp.]
MKKILLSSLAVFITLLSHAQIKKGTVFIGGNINFLHQSGKTDDSIYIAANPATNFSFSPSVGWAIKDNLVFGIDLGYGYQKDSYNYPGPAYYNKLNSYSGGVFLRKYKTLGSGFYLFGQTDLGFTYTKTDHSAGRAAPDQTKTSTVGLSFYPGVAYRLSSHWQLETGLPGLAHITYSHINETNYPTPASEAHASSNSFNAGTTLGSYFQFSVGILYVI